MRTPRRVGVARELLPNTTAVVIALQAALVTGASAQLAPLPVRTSAPVQVAPSPVRADVPVSIASAPKAEWKLSVEHHQGGAQGPGHFGPGTTTVGGDDATHTISHALQDVTIAPGFRVCVRDPRAQPGKAMIDGLVVTTPVLTVGPLVYGCVDIELPAKPLDAAGSATVGIRATQQLSDRAARTITGTVQLTWTRRRPSFSISIPQYRPGGAPDHVFQNAVIDPSVVGDPVAEDGTFTLRGRCLFPRTTFRADGKDLKPLGKHILRGCTEESSLRFQGTSFASRSIEVSGPNGSVVLRISRIGYRDLPPEMFADTLQKLSLSLGKPKGRGALGLGAVSEAFPVGGVNEKGVKLDIVDLQKKAARLRFEPGPHESEAIAVLEVDFESDGRELEGSFLKQIDVHRCGALEVRVSDCAGVDLACFGRVLGGTLKSAPACMTKSAWGPARVNGPSAPLSGDFDDAKLTLRIRLGVDHHLEKLVALDLVPSITGRIALAVADRDLPLSRAEVQERIFAQVNAALRKSAGSTAIVKPLVDAVHALLVIGLGPPMYLSTTARNGLWADHSVPSPTTRSPQSP